METKSFIYTSCQTKALSKVNIFLESNDNIFVLKGAAGTGKTTLIKTILNNVDEKGLTYTIMAPTGRAARVIGEKTNNKASTIHKAIYHYEDLNDLKIRSKKDSTDNKDDTYEYYFALKHNDNSRKHIYIIDESSMISNRYSDDEFIKFGTGFLLNDLFRYVDFDISTNNRKIIFIGDYAQLPPVNMHSSPALDIGYLKSLGNKLIIKDYRMTEIVRQKRQSEVLKNATYLRNQIDVEQFHDFHISDKTDESVKLTKLDLIDRFIGCYKIGLHNNPVLITHTNACAQTYNTTIREKLFKNIDLQINDTIMAVKNSYKNDILNGELCIVKEIISESEIIRQKLTKKGGGGQIEVSLSFKTITMERLNIKGQKEIITLKVIEDLLSSKERCLSDDQQRALYVITERKYAGLKKDNKEAFKKAIMDDSYFNALHIKYGYSITCHKGQGGEWNPIFIDFSYYSPASRLNMDFFRWAYTAITRGSKKMYFANAPSISNIDIFNAPIDDQFVSELNQTNETEDFNIEEINVQQGVEINNDYQLELMHSFCFHTENLYKVIDIIHGEYNERYLVKDINGSTYTVKFHYNRNWKVTSINCDNPQLSDMLKNIDFIVLEDENSLITGNNLIDSMYNQLRGRINDRTIKIIKIEQKDYDLKYFFKKHYSIAILKLYHDSKFIFNKRQTYETNNNLTEIIKGDLSC